MEPIIRAAQVREEDSSHKVTLIDKVMADSRLYRHGPEFKALLEFIVRLKGFAPFNAMLLQIQKPGLAYAASAEDWQKKFARLVKPGARPLLILRPFGPVSLVFDVADTEGAELPAAVDPFRAVGKLPLEFLKACFKRLPAMGVFLRFVDEGSLRAGSIQTMYRTAVSTNLKVPNQYEIWLNQNLSPEVQFATLVHELGHLYLGHLGKDPTLEVPGRMGLSHSQEELEAEAVAYLVCHRIGIVPNSASYLSNFFSGQDKDPDFDLHEILKAAGKIEDILKLDQFEPVRASQNGAAQLPLFPRVSYVPEANYQLGKAQLNRFDVKTKPWVSVQPVKATLTPTVASSGSVSANPPQAHAQPTSQKLKPPRELPSWFVRMLISFVGVYLMAQIF
jgi:hypothetical protein